MASSSSSAQERLISCPLKQYDAFISHRGPDVKDTLAKQLYERLHGRRCRAFLDREEIEGGDSIPAAISNGIRSSAVQIAIFSKGYAESSWCLDELVLMLEQKREEGALFIPVFYDVKPWELRHIEKDKPQYAQAFSSYQSKGRNLDRLDPWKKALESAADISGYERSQHHEDCRDLCEKIVSRVVQEMQKRTPLIAAKYPVALDELVQDFENSCPHTAGLVGIFGLGGSGKTTLTKELFNRKRATKKYGASSFLSDVRESYANRQLHSLQNQLLEDLFNEKSEFRNVDEGTARLKYRLSRANNCKLLIVLDDVDSQDLLDALLPEVEGILSSGSLVIITTRDQSVLTAAGATFCFKMKPLDRDHSQKLFCSHALLPRDSPIAYENLVESFIEYCTGLPLALKVLGAHVRGRDEGYWKLELEKVKRIPPDEIMQRLKISFDGLDKEEKQIFIDIACFFNKREYVDIESVLFDSHEPPTIGHTPWQRKMYYKENTPISIWKASGWSVEHALQTLQDKCLIEVHTIDRMGIGLTGKVTSYVNWWQFEMHDHLRDLGRQMADELGPPRLWRPDILRSMEEKGFKQILAETKASCFNSFEDSSLRVSVEYFIGISNDSAETELLWLEIENEIWFNQLPSWIPLRKLHYLSVAGVGRLRNSFQQQIQTNTQASFELRRLHISDAHSLRKLPKLGQLKRLNALHVEACPLLQTMSGLSSLTGLQSLHVYDCSRLQTISDISSLTGLQSLHVEKCPKLKTTFSLSSLPELQCLHVQGCSKCELMFCEEFETVANRRTLERIAILECGGVQRVEGFQELRGLKSVVIGEPENGNAWVRNRDYILTWVEAECTLLKEGRISSISSNSSMHTVLLVLRNTLSHMVANCGHWKTEPSILR